MFEHEAFDRYAFEDIPLNRDIYLMDEKWMPEYETSLLRVFAGKGGDDEPVGYISYACARKFMPEGAELSWYPNVYDRFHEVAIWLPKDAYVTCVGSWRCDEKPRIFVKGDWLNHLHLRSYTVFALIDAVGVKAAIRSNTLTRDRLVRLRSRIDDLAAHYPEVWFISFADSLLLKSNWTVGHYESAVKYTYRPEIFFKLFAELRGFYQEELGLEIYATLTQGSNEYYDDDVTHVSASGNHISLNSLGLPFAQLMAIDEAARAAIRSGVHSPNDLYMDELFFRSIRFKHSFEKNRQPRNRYSSPMKDGGSHYFYASADTVLSNLDPDVFERSA
jgi:hypothetical protein